MTKWEYKFIITIHNSKFETDGEINTITSAGFSSWVEDYDELPLPVNLTKKFQELGEAGWELVTSTPISSQTISPLTKRNLVPVPNMAGLTSAEIWVFKRPA